MHSIGFVISGKENERRRAVLPADLASVHHRSQLYFEQGYGAPVLCPDGDYMAMGCHVAPRCEVYACDVICGLKAPEPEERLWFGSGQTLFGWVHAVQGVSITDFLLERGMTAICWEDMFEDGRHCFWRNNEIAGEAAVLHASVLWGASLDGVNAAILGCGNCARGAHRALARLGAHVTFYDRKCAASLHREIGNYDVVVNAVLWDVFRQDHLLDKADVRRMKRGSLIIDVSCDEAMGIETSRPTTVACPVYESDGVMHYVVDHTPTLLHRAATAEISKVVARFLDELVEGQPGTCLRNATAIRQGRIVNSRVLLFQKRQPAAEPVLAGVC